MQGNHCVEKKWWTLYVDWFLNPKGVGAAIILEGPNDVVIEKSLDFSFKALNNHTEYEVIIVGLTLSRLIVSHLTGEYQVKDTLLLQYYHIVRYMIDSFLEVKLDHVLRSGDVRADILSKLANTKAKRKI